MKQILLVAAFLSAATGLAHGYNMRDWARVDKKDAAAVLEAYAQAQADGSAVAGIIARSPSYQTAVAATKTASVVTPSAPVVDHAAEKAALAAELADQQAKLAEAREALRTESFRAEVINAELLALKAAGSAADPAIAAKITKDIADARDARDKALAELKVATAAFDAELGAAAAKEVRSASDLEALKAAHATLQAQLMEAQDRATRLAAELAAKPAAGAPAPTADVAALIAKAVADTEAEVAKLKAQLAAAQAANPGAIRAAQVMFLHDKMSALEILEQDPKYKTAKDPLKIAATKAILDQAAEPLLALGAKPYTQAEFRAIMVKYNAAKRAAMAAFNKAHPTPKSTKSPQLGQKLPGGTRAPVKSLAPKGDLDRQIAGFKGMLITLKNKNVAANNPVLLAVNEAIANNVPLSETEFNALKQSVKDVTAVKAAKKTVVAKTPEDKTAARKAQIVAWRKSFQGRYDAALKAANAAKTSAAKARLTPALPVIPAELAAQFDNPATVNLSVAAWNNLVKAVTAALAAPKKPATSAAADKAAQRDALAKLLTQVKAVKPAKKPADYKLLTDAIAKLRPAAAGALTNVEYQNVVTKMQALLPKPTAAKASDRKLKVLEALAKKMENFVGGNNDERARLNKAIVEEGAKSSATPKQLIDDVNAFVAGAATPAVDVLPAPSAAAVAAKTRSDIEAQVAKFNMLELPQRRADAKQLLANANMLPEPTLAAGKKAIAALKEKLTDNL